MKTKIVDIVNKWGIVDEDGFIKINYIDLSTDTQKVFRPIGLPSFMPYSIEINGYKDKYCVTIAEHAGHGNLESCTHFASKEAAEEYVLEFVINELKG
jgi:hypothetical protein